MAEETAKPKHRPIIRIGLFLISHSIFFSVVCCVAAMVTLLLLPILAKNTYISENALMPGSASPMLNSDDVSVASRLMSKILSFEVNSVSSGMYVPLLIDRGYCNVDMDLSQLEMNCDNNVSDYNWSLSNLFTSPPWIDDGWVEYHLNLVRINLRDAVITFRSVPLLIAEHIKELGGEVNHHKFESPVSEFRPLNFFSSPETGIIQENYSCSSHGINTIGILRAPRGDGKESIVLVTPYNPVRISDGEALSLGIAFSVFSLLSRVTWLAKDVIWLAADSQHGDYAGVASWLRDYHTPRFVSSQKERVDVCHEKSTVPKVMPVTETDIYDDFHHAGTMAAALVIKVANSSQRIEKDALTIYAEASNGQMPNLDLINIVNYLAVHSQGFRVKVESSSSLLEWWWVKRIGEVFESLGNIARALNPAWNFGISVAEYVEGFATLASSLYKQALGIPTGPHGAFRDYQIDAVTLEISPKASSNYNFRQNEVLLRSGRLVEGVIRSVNNLLEKFHQSFFLYLLTSPSKFVSVGVYMIALAFLLAPLPLVAASLFSDRTQSSKAEEGRVVPATASVGEATLTSKSWRWLQAAKTVFVVHLWGATVALTPYFLSRMHFYSPQSSLATWIVSSVVSQLSLHLLLDSSSSLIKTTPTQGKEWILLKSVTIAAAFIGLCIMSVINFATAEIGALLLVPMCLMSAPLRSTTAAKNLRATLHGACNLLLVGLAFPPVALFICKGALEGFSDTRFDAFWSWVEPLWLWSSATYIYLSMVHLPCWALCVQILLHPA